MSRQRRDRKGPLMLVASLAVTIGGSGIPAEAAMRSPSFVGITALVDGVRLIVPASQLDFSVEDIEGVAGEDLPVTIKLPPAAEIESAGAGPVTFILIRNMPAGMRLSAGMASGRLWVLPLHDADGLRLLSKPEAVGDFTLEFSLIGSENRALARKTVALNLKRFEISERMGTAAVARPDRSESREPLATTGTTPPESPATTSPAEEKALLERGQKLMSQGSIVAARIIFEELARIGSAKGTLALARSYDPVFVQKSKAVGVTTDLGKALEWYSRAEALGSTEARGRIAEIVPRR